MALSQVGDSANFCNSFFKKNFGDFFVSVSLAVL